MVYCSCSDRAFLYWSCCSLRCVIGSFLVKNGLSGWFQSLGCAPGKRRVPSMSLVASAKVGLSLGTSLFKYSLLYMVSFNLGERD